MPFGRAHAAAATLAEPMDRAGTRMELDAEWRTRAAAAQEEAIPSGRVAVSAPAPFGVGGLGRHLAEIVRALERRGAHVSYVCESSGAPGATADGETDARELTRSRTLAAALAPLTRLSPPARMWAAITEFDRRAARVLREDARAGFEHLIAFNGAALDLFRGAGAPGGDGPSLRLVSATAHIRTVISMHKLAYRQYPLERSWAPLLSARTLGEYARAHVIYVSSERVRESFLAEGFAEERLVHFPLTPDPRYARARDPRHAAGHAAHHTRTADVFEIVYVGGLSVVKGVPLLIDAVAQLPHEDLRLVLVGGWGTRGMRRFIERARARDGRVTVALGDPHLRLQTASLYVHPSYDDGFGYAPAEALAAGVPVIATESTGMKDLIVPHGNGALIAGGDVRALAEAIDAAYRGELLRG